MMNKFILLLLVLTINGCVEENNPQFVPNDKWQKMIYNDIHYLSSKNLRLNRTIAEKETVENEKLDSLTKEDWMNELEMFLTVNTEKEINSGNFDSTDDQSGKYRITNFYNNDTLAALQQFQIMKFENKVQIISWKLRNRSWMMDRDVEMSYQPKKGYRIQVNENSMWKSPRSFEIFAEIENPEYLTR